MDGKSKSDSDDEDFEKFDFQKEQQLSSIMPQNINISNEITQDRDPLYLTEIQRDPDSIMEERSRNKLNVIENLQQFFTEKKGSARFKKANSDCDEHCILKMERDSQRRLLSGLQSLNLNDFAFFDYLNFSDCFEDMFPSPATLSEKNKVNTAKMNILNDLICDKVKIEDIVEPKSLELLEKNLLYRSKLVEFSDKDRQDFLKFMTFDELNIEDVSEMFIHHKGNNEFYRDWSYQFKQTFFSIMKGSPITDGNNHPTELES